MHRVSIVVAALLIGLAQWGTADTPKAVPPAEEVFHKELKQAAHDYIGWGRVDDEMRWAPTLCRTPMPGRAAWSESRDEETHGQKLYSLFVKNRPEYGRFPKDKPVAVGQAIVKQSWVPEEIVVEKDKPKAKGFWVDFDKVVRTPPPKGSGKDLSRGWEGDHFYPYAKKGDKIFKVGKQADLFIMLKLDPKTPDTDEGWVYGTVAPDGKKVTSAGKVESCIKCHKEATNDRLFGLR